MNDQVNYSTIVGVAVHLRGGGGRIDLANSEHYTRPNLSIVGWKRDAAAIR